MNYWNSKKPFNVLVDKILTDVKVNDSNDEIRFYTEDGFEYLMLHMQDCCENVSIEDINGDWADVKGTPILVATEQSDDQNPKSETYGEGENAYTSTDESSTWTFYTIATLKGYVQIRWYGASNGYYSESVDLVQVTPSIETEY